PGRGRPDARQTGRGARAPRAHRSPTRQVEPDCGDTPRLGADPVPRGRAPGGCHRIGKTTGSRLLGLLVVLVTYLPTVTVRGGLVPAYGGAAIRACGSKRRLTGSLQREHW